MKTLIPLSSSSEFRVDVLGPKVSENGSNVSLLINNGVFQTNHAIIGRVLRRLGGQQMEMSQIRYVLAAVRLLNFTKAATACNVSQPALTKGVRSLEEELGAPIFLREGKRIILSEFGRSMLPHLQHIAEETEATHLLAKNFRLLEKVPVRLGVMSSIGHVRLARFLAQFQKANSGLELSVSENSVANLKEKLSDGEIDVGIMTCANGAETEFQLRELYCEKYVVVFPPEHRLGRLNAVALSDLSGEPYVDRLACEMREMVIGVCKQRGVELYARFRSEREDWVQAMVLAGIGFAFMPEYSVSFPGLIQRPLVEPSVERRIAALTVPGRRYSPAVAAFMRSAHSFAWPG